MRRRTEAVGVGIYPAVPYYATLPESAEFLVGFASLTETEIEDGVKRIADVVDAMLAEQ
jgi:DNA-binding transcriptional MocR family regulator